MINLFEVKGSDLVAVRRKQLPAEDMLQEWIAKNPELIGLDVLVLGRELQAEAGRIDILAIDSDGDLLIIELKRDRTPREVVAQTLDYASWVNGLTARQVYEIALEKSGIQLAKVFSEKFGSELPETLNGNHRMVIVASEFDASSKRIVEYLNEVHGVNINATFFSVFEQDGKMLLATDWLMPQEQVAERADRKTKAPWGGLWYVNVGDGSNRSWKDMRQYGFLAAGSDPVYSDPLRRLQMNDRVFAYQKGRGYVGYGRISSSIVPVTDFQVNGHGLLDQKLEQDNLRHDANDLEKKEYVVGVEWITTFPLDEAKTFPGIFANPNIVCKLRDANTIEFLDREFGRVAHTTAGQGSTATPRIE
jgi:Endonuclease NucS C-terminal domain